MKTTLGLAIIAVLYSSGSTKAERIRGVLPSEEHLYVPEYSDTGEQIWRCLGDPSIVLSYNQINDDFCDCPDGSDEPGTNACPFNPERMFYCENEGYYPNYIENYKLNDGVCDYDICCDGSDEYATGKCPNKCKEIKEQFEEYKKNALQVIESATNNREKLILDAAEERKMVEMSISALRNKLKDLELAEKPATEKIENENTNVNKIKPHLDAVSELLESQIKSEALKDKKIEYLESVLSKLMNGYNPNFNDLVVKESVSSFKEYLSNSETETPKAATKEDLNRLTDLILANIPEGEDSTPTFGNYIHQQYLKAIEKFSGGQQVLENTKISTEKQSQNEKLKKQLKQELVIYEGDLDRDYGPHEILRAVKSTRIGGKLDEYNYLLEFFGTIYQDNVLIGQFERFENNALYYSNGAKCWNGPKRSAVVHLLCGAESKLLSVSEPEKCEYSFEMTSPIACDNNSEKEILSKFRINYDLL